MERRSRLSFFSKSPKPPRPRPTTSTGERIEPSLSTSVHASAFGRVSSSPNRQSRTPSLWRKAYEQLDSDLVERFNELLHQEALSSDSNEIVPNSPTRDDVDRICQDGQRRMEQAETTFRLNNKEHKAHDAFVKGLAVITWAKGLVSTALDKASSPEASLAWAAAILVLPLFENIGTAREANKTGFTYVTASMEFYVALQTEFRSLGSSVFRGLADAIEESIVDLYRNILEFQLRSAIRFNRNKIKNKFRDAVDYDGWKALLQDVKNAENLVNQKLELLQSTVGLDSLQSLRAEATRNFQALQDHLEELRNISWNTDEMVGMMQKSEARAMSEAEQKHLQSLRHHNATQDQSYELAKDRTEKRVDGTCQWLLADKQYQAWISKDSGLLVISADPGCGKSVLSRYLIEEGLPREDLTICYFFFKDEVQDRVYLALCALLHQLLVSKPFLITECLAPVRSKNGESFRTNLSALWKVLESALQDARTGRVVIVVDGLDECKPGELIEFSDRINSLFSEKASAQQTRFIVTTRPYPQITSRFKAPHIRVAGELESGTIREEVKLVIQHRVQVLENMPEIIPSALLPQLKQQLLSVDHPTYLWIALTFKFIESGKFKKTKRGLHEAIKRLPRTINEAYEKILRKTDPEDKGIIRRALTIVLGAKRPMSVDEMNVALNLTPDMTGLDELDLEEKDVFATSLRNWTGLFITIYDECVYFLHQTVREFLVGHSSNSLFDTQELGHWHGTFGTCEANRMLASIFLQYIPLYCNYRVTEPWGIETMPIVYMYKFAVHYVKDHLMDDIGDELLDSAAHVLAQFGRHWAAPLRDPPGALTDHELALLLAAWNGLHTMVVYLITSTAVPIECCDGRGRTPLVLALQRDWPESMDLKKMTKLKYSRTSLRRLRPAQSATALALLEAGANPNPELGNGLYAPIVTAIYLQDLPMVTKLIAHGANVNADSGNTHSGSFDGTYTALHRAVIRGANEIVRTLLLAGANIQARTSLGMTPLHLAVKARSLSKTSLLLAHGADVDSKCDNGKTPLCLAKIEQLVVILIRAGADFNVRMWDEDTILHRAAWRNWSDAVKVLCSRGADIEAKNNQGLTPLHQAVMLNLFDMTRLLISCGGNVNATDNNNITPLYSAMFLIQTETAALLISSGADVNASCGDGKTPLHYTANWNLSIFSQLLVSKGADVRASDQEGSTPLHYAARGNSKEVAALLVSAGAQVNAMNNAGQTPLMVAKTEISAGVMGLLLMSNPKDNVADTSGL